MLRIFVPVESKKEIVLQTQLKFSVLGTILIKLAPLIINS